jgi:histidinol-phosphatase (PHP family)
MIINDYHIHSALSHDSETPAVDFVSRATELGLTAIGLSEHKDFDPADPMRGYFDYQAAKQNIDKLRRDNPQLTICFGLEVDYRSWLQEEIADYLRQHPFDYTIGSVHYIVKYKTLEKQLAENQERELYESYFREVSACARSGLFDILGHADYVKRVAEKQYGPYHLDDYLGQAQEIVDAALANNMVLESNTKALRAGLTEPFPNYSLLELYAARGGKKLILGSDAHQPHELCHEFTSVWEHVRQMGLELWQPTLGGND